MEIKTLLEAFEELLPIYEKAYKAPLMSEGDFYNTSLSSGLCYASFEIIGVFIYESIRTHYENYLFKNRYLFNIPKTNKDLKPRIDFLKQEIPYLKGLIKKGYTHI